jgi:hypothetical protein
MQRAREYAGAGYCYSTMRIALACLAACGAAAAAPADDPSAIYETESLGPLKAGLGERAVIAALGSRARASSR